MRIPIAVLFSIVAGWSLSTYSFADEEKAKDEKPAAAAEEKAEKKETAEKGEKAEAKATDEKEAPEFIKLDKTGKMAPVNFPHKKHAEALGGCKDCHEGEKPLFNQKRSGEGLKMKDMYAGETCGKCHDGKMKVKDKAVFAAKTGCMKCHKK